MLFRSRKASLFAVVAALTLSSAVTQAATLTWGVNGAGGSGNWDLSTLNWFNGSQNVSWPSGGDAIFAGAAGTVNSFTFGPTVTSITFNTPGYIIQSGWIDAGTGGLTVNANADGTIGSTLSGSSDLLAKNGAGVLTINGTNFLGNLQINQGEVRTTGNSSFFFSDINMANTAGVTATLAQSSSSTSMGALSGGGALGGVVHPNNQARTVTLTVFGGGNFGGRMEDNGPGILAVSWLASNATQTLTGVNTYSGATRIDSGTLLLSGNGAIANSPSLTMSGTLVLDNSTAVVPNRIADTAPVSMTGSSIQLKGNSSTPVEELMGALTFTGVNNIAVTQQGNLPAQLTFAGLQRNDHAVLNVSGPGVKFTGLTNSITGIVQPYITVGTEWVVVGGDGRIAPLASYTSDINTSSTNDHVKFSSPGTFTLTGGAATRGSFNFQNPDSLVPQILDLAGQSLALGIGGILSSGNATNGIQNGTLSTASGEFVITANNNLVISSSIANGFGGTAVTKSGTGTLTLSGTNNYAGPTSILQGTLIATSDASLGTNSTIELSGGTLKAGGSFTSAKQFVRNSSVIGAIDTAGFNLSFSGANSAGFTKKGLGSLTMNNSAAGSITQTEGSLILPAATAGAITLQGGTLQVNGFLTSLNVSVSPSLTPTLDIGGLGAGTLSTNLFQWGNGTGSTGNMRLNYGLGSLASDFLDHRRHEQYAPDHAEFIPLRILQPRRRGNGHRLPAVYLFQCFDDAKPKRVRLRSRHGCTRLGRHI